MPEDKDKKEEDFPEELNSDPGDEVVFEENTEEISPNLQGKFEKLKDRIKTLEKEKADLLLGWQRDRADFINARKQDEKSKEEFLKFSKGDTLAELIPVLDSFESAFKNKEVWEEVPKNWRVGVEYIHTQLLNVLTKHGLKIINPIGEVYNPVRDEAVGMITVEKEGDDGKVMEIVQIGYEFLGKEVRAPKVRVGELKKDYNLERR